MKKTKKEECPECGKIPIKIRNYKNGDRNFIHSEKPGLFGFIEFDGCYIKKKGDEMKMKNDKQKPCSISCNISKGARKNLNQLKMDLETRSQDEALDLLLIGDMKALEAFSGIVVLDFDDVKKE